MGYGVWLAVFFIHAQEFRSTTLIPQCFALLKAMDKWMDGWYDMDAPEYPVPRSISG
jgi:hypothetical protein